MTGWRIWWYFVAFFGFVAAVNAGMVTMALRTHSGLVTDHPYEKGLAYNQVVEAEKKQQELGWNAEIALRHPDESRDPVLLIFSLKDKIGTTLTPEKATATITRPTQKGMDFTLELMGAETPVNFPAQGLWEVRVDAKLGDINYQQSKRIVVE
jgi:nitrogen fixation protein FixH